MQSQIHRSCRITKLIIVSLISLFFHVPCNRRFDLYLCKRFCSFLEHKRLKSSTHSEAVEKDTWWLEHTLYTWWWWWWCMCVGSFLRACVCVYFSSLTFVCACVGSVMYLSPVGTVIVIVARHFLGFTRWSIVWFFSLFVRLAANIRSGEVAQCTYISASNT